MARTWTVVGFGKHDGKTLPQIVLSDPDWFFWAFYEGVFNNKSAALKRDAEDVALRAKAIRPRDPARPSVEYYFLPGRGFARLEFVEEDRPRHEGGSWTVRLERIDLSTPRGYKDYDKTGCRILLAAVKDHLGMTRVTRKIADEFFADDSNFFLP